MYSYQTFSFFHREKRLLFAGERAEQCPVAPEKKQPTETEVRKSAKEMRWGDRKSDLIWSAIWNTDTQKPEEKNANLALIGCNENTDILSRIQAFQQYLDVDMNIAARASNPHEADRMIANLKILEEKVRYIYNEFRKARGSLARSVEASRSSAPSPQPSTPSSQPVPSAVAPSVPHEKQTTPTETFLAELPEGIQSDMQTFFDSKEGKLFKELFSEEFSTPEKSGKFVKKFLDHILEEPSGAEIGISKNFLAKNFGYDEEKHGGSLPKLLARLFQFNPVEGTSFTAQDVFGTKGTLTEEDMINSTKIFLDGMGISLTSDEKILEVSDDIKKMLQAGSGGFDRLAKSYKESSGDENESFGEEDWESFWTWITGIFSGSGKTLDEVQDSLERVDARGAARKFLQVKERNSKDVQELLKKANGKSSGDAKITLPYQKGITKDQFETFLNSKGNDRENWEKQIGAAALGLNYPSQVKGVNLEVKIDEKTEGVEVTLYQATQNKK